MNSNNRRASVIILCLVLCMAVAGAAACAVLNNSGDSNEGPATTEFIEYIQNLPDETVQPDNPEEAEPANIWAPLENTSGNPSGAEPGKDTDTADTAGSKTDNKQDNNKGDYVVPLYDKLIFVGDSRTVQLEMAVSYNRSKTVFIGESGMGYQWFAETAVFQADAQLGPYDSAIIINMGVNDLGDVKQYASLVNRKAAEWKLRGATVYYSSVTPVYDGYPTVSNAQIVEFNNTLKGLLSSDIYWIDSYSYLMNNGFTATDGLHYDKATYKSLYSYYFSIFGLK